MPLLGRQLLGDSERHTGRDDAHLQERVGVGKDVGEHRVTAFVEGDPLLLVLGEHHRVAPLSHEDPIASCIEVAHLDVLAAPSHGVECRLVDKVRKVGAAHAGRPARDDCEVDVGSDPLVATVNLQDRDALVEIW